MKKLPVVLITMIVWGMALFPKPLQAQDVCPTVPADGTGVQRIEGLGSYSFYGIPTIIVDQPVIALIDDGLATQGDSDTFPPNDGQVLGVITSDFFSSPFSFTVNLPVAGSGLAVDLDQDGGQDAGVQVYKVALAQNVMNTVPLVGIAQSGILQSYYRDEVTEEIIQGALVIYAPDDQQGFPCGYGADRQLFTDDDPIVTLPQGFTVANISNQTITFDRSEVVRVDVFESPGSATPDFSDQGIVESFNTLTDFLRERYVFNEFNDIDWDALYATYLPLVEEAEANENLAAYFVALVDLAHDLADAHVYVQPGNILSDPEGVKVFQTAFGRYYGSIGAELVELEDGRIIVTDVNPDMPGAATELEFGTEIVNVDGLPVEEALEQSVRFVEFPGTPESKRITAVRYLLRRPPNTEIEIGYILPNATDVMTTTLTTVLDLPTQSDTPVMPMEYSIKDGVGYVTWSGFERTGIATHIFADFIKVMNQRHIPGIIIDLRSNGGGSALMEYAIMSYLFDEENPLSFGIADRYLYNELTGEFVREPQTLELSTPPASQPYDGDVVILVNQNCASACEFMSYWLQASGRATIVGHYATEGAGGNTNAVYLPGGMQFNYTAGTDLDNETDLPTFQGRGVQPNIRVPVTEEIEQLKQEGSDPVLDAGINHLRRLAFERLDPQPVAFANGTIMSEAPTGWTPNATEDGLSSPDQPIRLSIMPLTTEDGTEDGTEPDTLILSTYPGARVVSELTTEAGIWSIYGVEDGSNFRVIGVIVIDDQPYMVNVSTTDENMVALMVEFIFIPALQSFEVVE